MAKKSTKRNPQDATLRNTRAALKRHRELASRVVTLETRLDALFGAVWEGRNRLALGLNAPRRPSAK